MSEQDLREAIRKDPFTADHWQRLGGWYLGQSKFLQALACFAKGLALNPGDGQLWGSVGMAYYRLDDHSRAATAWALCMQKAPRQEFVQYLVEFQQKGVIPANPDDLEPRVTSGQPPVGASRQNEMLQFLSDLEALAGE